MVCEGKIGYITSASINGRWLRLLPSTIEESENLIKSEDAYGTDPALTVGAVPTRNRRNLNVNFSFELSEATSPLIDELFLNFRNFNDITVVLPATMTCKVNTGEGYESSDFYAESMQFSSQEDSLVTCTVSGKCWTFTETDSADSEERLTYSFLPTLTEHHPIPHWRACMVSAQIPGTCVGWSVSLNNNWQYEQLLEAQSVAPSPQLIWPGRLDCTLESTVLAERNERPDETAVAQIRVERASGNIFTIDFPTLIRDPSRTRQGWGDAKGKILWVARYYSFGAVPVFTLN